MQLFLVIVEQSHWINSLEPFSYSYIRHLQYKLDRKITFNGCLTSIQIIEEDLGVGIAIGQYIQDPTWEINTLSRDGKQVKKFKTEIPIFKIIQTNTGELITASGSHGI